MMNKIQLYKKLGIYGKTILQESFFPGDYCPVDMDRATSVNREYLGGSFQLVCVWGYKSINDKAMITIARNMHDLAFYYDWLWVYHNIHHGEIWARLFYIDTDVTPIKREDINCNHAKKLGLTLATTLAKDRRIERMARKIASQF